MLGWPRLSFGRMQWRCSHLDLDDSQAARAESVIQFRKGVSMKQSFRNVISISILGFLLFSGCNKRAGDVKKIAFVTNNAADFWTIARKGTEKAQQEVPGVEVEFRIPSNGGADEQKRIVDDLLAKGIDGMAISPVDPANQTQMINDAMKQTLVITQDSDAPNSNRICYIG